MRNQLNICWVGRNYIEKQVLIDKGYNLSRGYLDGDSTFMNVTDIRWTPKQLCMFTEKLKTYVKNVKGL